MNQTIERTTLSNLVSNEEYCRKVLPFIKPDYFDVKEERVVFEEITNFVDKYKRIPTKISLEIEVESRKDLTEDQHKKIVEIKSLKLNKLIDIRVNKKQVGSDRLANSIAAIDSKKNYIIIDFGTATTFDVLLKKKYLGGIISPGINLSLNTLTSRASLTR